MALTAFRRNSAAKFSAPLNFYDEVRGGQLLMGGLEQQTHHLPVLTFPNRNNGEEIEGSYRRRRQPDY